MKKEAITARRLSVMDLGRQAYGPAVALQNELVARRQAGEIADTLLFVEHEHVYTLGRSADARHVVAAPAELARMGVEVVSTGRGGDVTYHGPGQLVGYPIIDLAALGKGVVWYVGQLEEAIIRTLAGLGVAAGRDPANRGVWVGDRKIAAIGVRVTRHVTMHGFALNVNVDMRYFGGIIPCGIAHKGVTSLHLLKPGLTMREVKERLVPELEAALYGDD